MPGRLRVPQLAGRPEVDEVGAPVGQEDVLRLHVDVGQAAVVEHAQGGQERGPQQRGVGRLERAVLVDDLGQARAVEVLHDQVRRGVADVLADQPGERRVPRAGAQARAARG